MNNDRNRNTFMMNEKVNNQQINKKHYQVFMIINKSYSGSSCDDLYICMKSFRHSD